MPFTTTVFCCNDGLWRFALHAQDGSVFAAGTRAYPTETHARAAAALLG